MARNSIGTLNVQVQADTSQFVNGMANAQRRTEQFTQAAAKMRTGVAAMGAAFRVPGLGRAGAFGGAASGVASALGIGTMTGGVAGLAATGTFLAVDGLLSQVRKIREESEKRLAAEREITDAMLKQSAVVDRIIGDLRASQGGAGAIAARAKQQAAFDQYQQQLEPLKARLAELEAMRQDRRNALAPMSPVGRRRHQAEMRPFYESLDREIEQITKAIAAAGHAYSDAINGTIGGRRPQTDVVGQFNETMARNGTSSIIRGVLGSIETRENPLREVFREMRASREDARRAAEEEANAVKSMAESLDNWTREMQQDSRNLATSVANIRTQVDHFARRRH